MAIVTRGSTNAHLHVGARCCVKLPFRGYMLIDLLQGSISLSIRSHSCMEVNIMCQCSSISFQVGEHEEKYLCTLACRKGKNSLPHPMERLARQILFWAGENYMPMGQS